MKKLRTVYCHFSFKRPKDKPGVGYFAVVFYNEKECKHIIAQRTVERLLWEDHQFITAIQAYEYALSFIHEWQGVMISKGIGQVLLVTDNSILAGWIENPKKNKNYEGYMLKATENYRSGGPKEITLGVGLCNVRNNERAYYYCCESKVAPGYALKDSKTESKIQVTKKNSKSVYDILDENEDEPEVRWGSTDEKI